MLRDNDSRRPRWAAFAAALAAVLALALAACGEDTNSSDDSADSGDSGGGSKTLTISNWDQYTPEDLIPSFEKETGIKVKLVKHATNEEVLGKLEAANGGGFDIVFVSGPFAESLRKRGWAAEIDQSKVPNLKNLYP